MSPAVVKLKSLFQEVTVKCDWDAPLFDNFLDKWRKVLSSLKNIGIISVPRHCLSQLDIKYVEKIELDGFRDASNIPIAAVLYVRILYSANRITMNFVVRKTKIY